MNKQSLLSEIESQYAAVARSGLSNDVSGVRAVAEAFGYAPEELASIPAQANMGLSCGNPVAIAGLREGEVVVDLGSGGGLDVFLAAKRVGPTGKAIGIDMTQDMLDRARRGAMEAGIINVDFHQSTIDNLPLADQSVDCVISNCVINLAPDKPAVFREILRVLKPGGRMVVSDIALRKPLPPAVANDIQAHVGCIAGALLISDYERLLDEAGFQAVVVQDTGSDLNAYAQAGAVGCCADTSAQSDSRGCCSGETACCTGMAETSELHDGLAAVMRDFDANAYAGSVRVHAIKAAE
jgi:arsenite methyltransferase